MQTELQEFSRHWERETDGTLALLRALPTDQYDFRPDTGGRSIGELAWHIAEVDAYVSLGINLGEFKFDKSKPPHIERVPRSARRGCGESGLASISRLGARDPVC